MKVEDTYTNGDCVILLAGTTMVSKDIKDLPIGKTEGLTLAITTVSNTDKDDICYPGDTVKCSSLSHAMKF